MQASEAASTDFLRRYHPGGNERARDIVENRYRVELSSPLPYYDTKNARAFAATDTITGNTNFYALVCRPGTLQRIHLVDKLKSIDHPNMVKLVAAGVAPLSQPQEERYVIVYQRPAGRKISELLPNTKEPLSAIFITKLIIAPLAGAIAQLNERDITHGGINPDNIYFAESPMLGDCVSEPSGLSQPFYFEPVERIQSIPSAKGDGDLFVDYYALAVLVLYLHHGIHHFDGLTPPTLIRQILKEGAYNALTRGKENPEVFYDFFRGMFSQNSHDRWNDRHLKPWLEGKRYNVLLPPPPAEAIRPFEFGGVEANTRREVAQIFYEDWANIPTAFKAGHLQHWVSVSLRNKELANQVARIGQAVAETAGRNATQLDEQLMRVLLLFDPAGPVRISSLAFHVDGLDSLCLDLMTNRSDKELQMLCRYIEYNMVSFWQETHRKDNEIKLTLAQNNMITRLDRARLLIRNTGYGFGLERILYELAPDLPCQSPLLAGRCVNSLTQMLLELDRMAPAMAGSHSPIDRHIAAFLASKMSMQHDIKIAELDGIPELASHQAVFALRLFAMAQERSTMQSLPGLANWVALRLLPAFEHIRSKTLRARLKTALGQCIEAGSLRQMANVVISRTYAATDKDGYKNATVMYHDSVQKMAAYRKGEQLDQRSARVGFALAKALSYIALIISLLGLVKELQA